ncbi:MAG: SDR family oxidoreductase [Proteobacteria bacterium]|nr:SDR family oxidoreductase [Pseudomonadota bacterium]
MWDLRIQGKTALITGAGRGIGRACAVAFAEAGAKVIAVARTAADLESLATEYPEAIEIWVNDVTEEIFYQRIEALTKLDVLVNNAGTNRPQPFVDVDIEALNSVIDLNVRAMFQTAQSTARVMVRNGSGSIINMSSQMGHIGSPNRSVYCMTKHAVEGLTKAMAVELAPKGVRVNALAPTFIETPMTRSMMDDPGFKEFVQRMIPLGKVGQPNDVAVAALYLASDASAMVTGHSLRIDGGWTAA